MKQQSQSYATHRRYFPLFHFIAIPILAANALIQIYWIFRYPAWVTAWHLVVALALVAGFYALRISTLNVQSRLIAFEMRARLARVLPPAQHECIAQLRVRDLVALRFASDAELSALVDRCVKGELGTTDAIKRAVKDWQGDFLRA